MTNRNYNGRMGAKENKMPRQKIIKIRGHVITEDDVAIMTYAQLEAIIADIIMEENVIIKKRNDYRIENAGREGTDEYIRQVNIYTDVLRFFNQDKAWLNAVKTRKGSEDTKYQRWCVKFYEKANLILPTSEVEKVKKAMDEE